MLFGTFRGLSFLEFSTWRPTWNITGIPPYFTIGNKDATAASILLPMARKPDFQFMVHDIILKAR